MRYIIVIITLFMLNSSLLYSQEKEDLIQFSGVLVSDDSLFQVSYASIINKTTGTGALSDYYGYFSLVTRPGDTIIFKAFGFKTNTYIVSDTLSQDRYSIIHIMTPKPQILPEVDVYPWPSREEFARAFVEMNPYDDAISIAQRRLSGKSLAAIAARVPTDAKLSYNLEMQRRRTLIITRGQTPINNLLNPVSWSRFIRAWQNGELKRE